MNLIIIIILFICIGMYLNQFEKYEKDVKINELNMKLGEGNESFYNKTFGLIETIKYQNLYIKENITTKNVVHNILNPMVYMVITEVNTIIPIITNLNKRNNNNMKETLIKIGIILIILILIFKIPLLIGNFIIIYFFIKEKKKDKTKIWE